MATGALVTRRWGWLVGPVLIAALTVQCTSAPEQGAHQPLPDTIPQCPHAWGPYIASRGDSLLDAGQVSLAKQITNIPEFHDCQRFLVVDQADFKYHALFAIWGAWDLEARFVSLAQNQPGVPAPRLSVTVDSIRVMAAPASFTPRIVTTIRPVTGTTTQSQMVAWGFTEIYAEGDYAPLGIARGFNCAYLFYAGETLVAKVVNYGSGERDCSAPIDPATVPGTVLQVLRTQHPQYQRSEDYPAVARWDWDAAHRIQYFGVKCGAAWCEIGPGGFTPSPPPASPSQPPALLASIGTVPFPWQRVFAIKGWFDEQRMDPVGVVFPPRPAPVGGRLFPDPGLDSLRKEHFRGQWRTTAWVAVDPPEVGYAGKLNFRPVGTGLGWNQIELCWGSWWSCVGSPVGLSLLFSNPCAAPDPLGQEIPEDHAAWWARITAPNGRLAYRCVRRRDHSAMVNSLGIRLPGTTRWHWYADDPLPWQRCDVGCCEVQQE